MQADANYLGAAVFWSYNVAALVFTAIAIYTIWTLHLQQEGQRRPDRRSSTLFAGLAAISFAVLSANMLNVLIQSFNLWSEQRGSPLSHGILPAIWEWSITSSLFLDFGEAIVADRARFFWTQGALHITMAVCLYMGYEGRRRRVPRLYAFFALSQILPISFAQNLFYLAVLQSPATTAKGKPEMRPAATAAVLIAYCASVAVAPTTTGTARLMPLIVFARLLLLTPLSLATPQTDVPGPVAKKTVLPGVAALALGVIAWQMYSILQQHTPGEIGRALFSHPAVSSLGCDAIISVISFVAWTSSLQIGMGRTNMPKKAL
ncbi:hypothetical protein LTR65_002139 [Meristemomyces frigidus]